MDPVTFRNLAQKRYSDESLCLNADHAATDCPADCPDYNMRDVFIYSAQNAEEMNGASAHKLQALYLERGLPPTPISGDHTTTHATN